MFNVDDNKDLIIDNFEYILHLFIVFLLLSLSIY